MRRHSFGQSITRFAAVGSQAQQQQQQQSPIYGVWPESIIVTGQAEAVFWQVTWTFTACIDVCRTWLFRMNLPTWRNIPHTFEVAGVF
jgi:hypothetical protein